MDTLYDGKFFGKNKSIAGGFFLCNGSLVQKNDLVKNGQLL